MSTLKSTCEKVLQVAEQIKNGSNKSLKEGLDSMGVLIANAEKMAHALLVMEKAILGSLAISDDYADYVEWRAIREALAKAEEIMEEK